MRLKNLLPSSLMWFIVRLQMDLGPQFSSCLVRFSQHDSSLPSTWMTPGEKKRDREEVRGRETGRDTAFQGVEKMSLFPLKWVCRWWWEGFLAIRLSTTLFSLVTICHMSSTYKTYSPFLKTPLLIISYHYGIRHEVHNFANCPKSGFTRSSWG